MARLRRNNTWLTRHYVFVLVGVAILLYNSKSMISRSGGGAKVAAILEPFPEIPFYKSEELEMCKQGPLKLTKNLRCNEGTCESCITGMHQRGAQDLRNFAAEFRHDHVRKPLVDFARQLHGEPRDGLIIVLLVADGKFMDFIINWYLHAKQFNPAMIIVGVDDNAKNLAAKYELPTAPITWKTRGVDDYYSRMFSWYPKVVQIHVLSTLVQAGYNVLLQDADAFWIRDPRPYLRSMVIEEGAEIQTQLAPRWDNNGYCNSGFVFVSNPRNNPLVPNFFQSLSDISHLLVFSQFDQPLWNGLFRHWKYRELNLRVLPFEKFRRINLGEKVLPETIVAHRVSGSKSEKIADLKVYNLWLL